MKLGNYGSLSPYDDAIEKQVDKYVKDRKGPIRKIKEEKKMTKAQIKKRDEIADAISTREMNKRYGDKNVKYAIATKLAMKEGLDDNDKPFVKKLVKNLRKGSNTHAKQADKLEKAMKENTAIESELVIQDWNSDDIKFTEIETVDIIKAKPLKENMSNWREDLGEDWQKVNRKDKTDGMSQKAVNAYKRENPGSNLKTAVTGKVKKGSKASKRRKSFCARSDGQRKMHNIDCKKTPNKRICKARRRWKC